MAYTGHIPSSPLDAYIDDLYYVDGPPTYARLKVLPMPSTHLMVNLGEAFLVYDSDIGSLVSTCRESWCVGLWSRYHIVQWPRSVKFYGVHFKPGGAAPFLQLPQSELHNRVVPLDAIWGQYAAELCDRLSAAPTIKTGFALLEQALVAHLCEAPRGLVMVQHAIEEIQRRHGTLSIHELSERIGVSQNHLGTQFKRLVGIRAKELARFYRFAHALGSVDPMQPVDWAWTAYQAGYYDQSHFNKDFTAFTGHSPTDYLQLRRHAQLASPDADEMIGQLPID